MIRESRRSVSPFVHADWVLIGVSILLAALGMLMIYSSTQYRLELQNLPGDFFLIRQASFLVLALAAMFVMMYVDYRVLRDLSPIIYVAMIVVLVLVLSPLGTTTRGEQSRFDLGFFQAQPSELSKVVVILAVASFCYQFRGGIDAWRLGQALALAALPVGLIVLQGDVGTAMVIPVTLLAMLLVAGARPRHLGVLLVFERRGRPFPGRTFWSYMLLYAISRYVVEIYRGDPRGEVLGDLNKDQRGIAVRLKTVPGESLAPDDDSDIQDFLMSNLFFRRLLARRLNLLPEIVKV